MSLIKQGVKFPPGGWIFFQAETGWRAPHPLARDRYQTARDISVHRKANPHKKLKTSEADALADLEKFTFHRLKGDPNYCIDDGAEKKTTEVTNTGQATERRALRTRVAALVVGADTLREWFGARMKPVGFPQAQGRADVCELCPKNVKGDWLNRLTGVVAAAVLKHLKLKTMLNLEVKNEKELGTCSACECQLPLKVWVPLEHIDMSPETLARLHRKTEEHPFDCWIVAEKERGE